MADPTLNIKIKADTGDATLKLRSFKTTLTELKSGVDLLQTGFGMLRDAAEKAFEMGKAGAELERVRGQLDNLAISIGTTSDSIITKMTDASGGLMSNAEMIQAATDIISLGLADNEDDVIRLATVVSELGWDMQQVILTFANNSTMRLDALGLSVEDVTAKAKAFEEQGFNADKAFDMAVLEAAEEKIGLVGSAAETAAGQYKILEANTKNLKDELSKLVNEALLPVVSGLNEQYDAAKDASLALELGLISVQDYNAAALGLASSQEVQLEAQQRVTEALEEQRAEWAAIDEASESFDRNLKRVAETTQETGDQVEESAEQIAEAAEDVYTFSDALDDASKGRPSPIASFIKDIQWLQAGGAEVATLFEDIQTALEEGVDPELIGDAIATTLVAALLTEIQAGQNDLEGASQTLQDTLGIDAAEADAMLSEFESAADAVAEAERQLDYAIWLDPDSEAYLNRIERVLGVDSHTLNLSVTGGELGSWAGPGTGGTSGGDREWFSTGGSFVIPPGFPNDSWHLGGGKYAESGETVTITPQGGGGQSVIVMIDGEEVAARVMNSAGRNYRQTLANGGGYAGR